MRTDASIQAFADCMLELVHLLIPDQDIGLLRQLLARSTGDMLGGNPNTISFLRKVGTQRSRPGGLCSGGQQGSAEPGGQEGHLDSL